MTLEHGEKDHQAFGQYLKALRRATHLTQKEVAQRCDISAAYLSLLERGSANRPSYRIVTALARLYDADLNEILDKAGYKVPQDRWAGRPSSESADEVWGRPFMDALAPELLFRRLDWAISCIQTDFVLEWPSLSKSSTSLSIDAKLTVTATYEQLTRRKLLTPEEWQGLKALISVDETNMASEENGADSK